MNYTKIQTELLKDWVKAKQKGKNTSYYFITDQAKGQVFITDGYAGYFIPQDLLLLDTKKMKQLSKLPFDTTGNFDDYRLEWNGKEQVINNKLRAAVLECSKWETYVDTKYLHNFDLKVTTFYQAPKTHSPVFAYEKQKGEDVLVGIILPIIKNK